MNDEINNKKMKNFMNYCIIIIIIIAALSLITIISMINFSNTEDIAIENNIENKIENQIYSSTTRNTVKKKDYLENKVIEETIVENTENDTPNLDALLKEMEGIYITAYNDRIELLSSPYEYGDEFSKIIYYFDENNYINFISYYFNFVPVAEENTNYANYWISLFEDIPDVIINNYEVFFNHVPKNQMSRDEAIQNFESRNYIVHYAE